jgi:hypothetical protein
MNEKQHTVTIPLADYQELIDAHKNSEIKYEKLKNALVDLLRRCSFGTYNTPSLEQVIEMIRKA